jgi:hypothetical protein
VLSWVERPATSQMTLDLWQTGREGDFLIKWDDRDIMTIRHDDVPATAGNYAQAYTRPFPCRGKRTAPRY